MRREIEMTLLPELRTAYARLAATWVCSAIDYLLLEEHNDPDIAEARAQLVAELPAGPSQAERFLPDLLDADRAIDAIAAAVRQSGPQTSASTIAKIGALTVRALQAEKHFLEQSSTAEIERLGALEIDVTPARLDRYFDSTSEFRGYRTQEIERMVGGYSRDTFLISTRTPEGGTAEFAVRRDLPFGPIETSAVDEFPILERLDQLGVPVARPRAAVTDKQFIGQPFLLSDRVAGRSATLPMSADRATGESGARQLARILARLHSLDPSEVGVPRVAGDTRDQIAAMLTYWRERWDRYRCVDSDVMEAAFAWLQANLPRNPGRTVIVHGDFRPDNAQMHEGRITAVLDWELIHAGSAAEDVEYMKLFVEPFLDPQAFVAEYVAAGGTTYDPHISKFYEVFRSVRNVVCTDTSWYGFLHGLYPSMRLSFQGTMSRRMLLGYLANALAGLT
jgi:aminoglycoside phosphotransferase (APT) family kinase protein